VWGVWLRPLAYHLLYDGFMSAELGDDGDEAAVSGGGGDAAVGGVVAEPDDLGDGGVECGEMEGGDVAGGAVDHEPRAGLPGPAWGLGGEGVVDSEGAADDEGAVGDVVDLAYGPLLFGRRRLAAGGRGGLYLLHSYWLRWLRGAYRGRGERGRGLRCGPWGRPAR